MSDKKVLFVEDDDSIRKTLFLILQERYKVHPVKSGQEALQKFRKSKIDLVITDLKLPDTDGLELIEKFREYGYQGEVILISGFPEAIDLDILRDLSIGYFFAKPLDLDELNNAIEYILDTKLWHEKRIASI
ncbi:MAG: response regulator [Candidatus Aminicenantes bacterium]|nr:response regulator [Candidatus Aminicenantes bacterium]